MKSKIRPITVENKEYNWNIIELDWNYVLLKVWIKDKKHAPWFTMERRFNNHWYFLGEVNDDNRENFQFEPVTPKHVAAAIKLVTSVYGEPEDKFRTLNLSVDEDGTLRKG